MKKIKLTQNQFALVDNEDYEELSKYKWCASKLHYGGFIAIRGVWVNGKTINISMHRQIMNVPKGLDIDHKNHETLDNRRCNLRKATSSQNHMNSRKRKGCSSRFKGVSWHKLTRKWRAYICLNGKICHLGLFINEIDAAKAYDKKAKELFGEFAYVA